MRSFRLALKPFAIWLALTLAVFGIFGTVYHLYRAANPTKVLVIVDSSFPMEAVWDRVPEELDQIGAGRYAEFSLVTEKERIHSWSSTLKPRELRTVDPYAPRNWDGLDYPEIEEAEEIYLLTNAGRSETEQFLGWKIVQVTP